MFSERFYRNRNCISTQRYTTKGCDRMEVQQVAGMEGWATEDVRMPDFSLGSSMDGDLSHFDVNDLILKKPDRSSRDAADAIMTVVGSVRSLTESDRLTRDEFLLSMLTEEAGAASPLSSLRKGTDSPRVATERSGRVRCLCVCLCGKRVACICFEGDMVAGAVLSA